MIEVAVSSSVLDRENASLYAEAGVREYWIVLGLEQKIEVYRQPQNGIYQQKSMFNRSDVLQCESVPAVKLSVADLFA